ncbi:MAG: DUF3859 domain-containing protein [Pseudomonadales bacterium]|nr:DUF3859 domain-containing protein [Pseudomonadales bacterium]MBO7007283.1 DUF3859 domain-containing protein [Pseudomonadales bacterium]
MNRTIFLSVLLVLAAVAHGDEEVLHISVAEIYGYGIFEASSSRRYSGSSSKTLAIDTVSGIRFTNKTTEIPGRVGTNFGFQYSLNSTPPGQKVAVQSIIRFPEPGLHHPNGRVYQKSVESKYIRIGEPSLHGYGFDEFWEIVPGEWRFEIWHGDARLIRKTFNVVLEDDS